MHREHSFWSDDRHGQGTIVLDERSGATAPLATVVVEATRGDVSCIQAIEPEWRALCDEGPCNVPFYRPEWLIAYLNAFERNATIVLLTARRAGRLRGVLPLVAETIGVSGAAVKRLRAPVNAHSNRFDLVHGAGDGDMAVGVIWQFLAEFPGWHVMIAPVVPEGGAFHQLMEMAEREGFPTLKRESLRSPYIPLPGVGGNLDAVLAHTSRPFRANVRRRMRKLEAKGPVQLVRTDHADQHVLNQFYEMERAGWKGREGTAIGCDMKTRAFYDDIARGAAQFGYLSLYELQVGGKAVASHLGLTLHDRYFVPKLTYDEAHRECSPGQLIIQEILRDCICRGLSEFDFLGPSMSWKEEWTAELRRHDRCYVFHKGMLGRALFAGRARLAPAAKRVGDATHEIVRSWRGTRNRTGS